MSAPRILLVDDQRQVIRMLRSSLEFSGRDYTVIDVPSGEEALLELARSPVDVLVTDLRLPGMSGLELLSRARQLNPEARAILLTGHPTEQVEYQAQSLGVVAFLRKPLATNYFLEAVERAVELAGTFGSPVEVLEEEKPGLWDLLETLRRSLDARAALLLDLSGEIVVVAGELGDLDLAVVLPSVTSALSAGLSASSLLGALLPTNLLHIEGDSHQIYVLNIGAFYGLLVSKSGRLLEGQLESVRRHGQAAVNDLLTALSQMGLDATAPPPAAVRTVAGGADRYVQSGAESAEPRLSPRPAVGPQTADEFWSGAPTPGKPSSKGEGDVMPYEEARRRGILKDPPE